ncbi:nicotinamidase-related amidase [Idiomarina loihiensis]|uniref:cysteine hydrolase n=1 Tax=Idiomarina TaxID=135575 RepID=UPI000D70D3D6|nr:MULTISPECIES: cysteine hydrolase [Idiomarina]PWW39467.1 nicotinamidase-related amidase [Idiomarina loihiensis]TDP49438.1 nicotinamidase-related amidase [Idiomarina loihiensis]TDS24248.1 nicotinamidase-related amidase [Idiomarina sp. H2]
MKTTNEKTALVLIEFQNEWLSEQGILHQKLVTDKSQLSAAHRGGKQWLARARKEGMHVVHVLMRPDENYQIFGEAHLGLRAAIPAVGSWKQQMADIHPDFRPLPREHVIRERVGASAFAGSNLDAYLRNNRISTMILCGFATHVCVESTLREAHDKGYDTYVAKDAVAAFNQEQQSFFFSQVVHHFGDVISLSRS